MGLRKDIERDRVQMKFCVGERVKVTNGRSTFFGEFGHIVHINEHMNHYNIEVRFRFDKSTTPFNEEELKSTHIDYIKILKEAIK